MIYYPIYPSTHLCDVCRCMHIPTHVWIFWGVCKASGLYAHKPWQFHDVSALRGFENSVLSSPIIRCIYIYIYIHIYIYMCVGGMYVYMIHNIYIISENRI